MVAMTVSGWLRYSVYRSLKPPEVESVLEIGAGRGAFGEAVSRHSRYVGLEPDPASFAIARSAVGAAGTVLQSTVESFASEQPFDAVCAFEVLEHIEDDVAALRSWQRHVRPGGWIFVSVPAGESRFGPMDVKAGHYRRYEREGLARALADSGLVESAIVSYGYPIGSLLLATMNRVAKRRGHADTMEDRTAESGRWLQPTRFTAFATRAVAAPVTVLQRPFAAGDRGIGYVARARRP